MTFCQRVKHSQRVKHQATQSCDSARGLIDFWRGLIGAARGLMSFPRGLITFCQRVNEDLPHSDTSHPSRLRFGYGLAGAPRRASSGRWAFSLQSELLWVCAINKVINQPIRTRPIKQSTNQKSTNKKSRFPNPRWPPIWIFHDISFLSNYNI